MKKVLEYLANEHIQIALATGSSIIILAIFFKRYLEIPVPAFESALPAFVFVGFEVLTEKRKQLTGPWSRPWPWILLMYLVMVLVIARRLLMS